MRTGCAMAAALAVACLSASAMAEPQTQGPPVWTSLSRFASDAEFRRYLADVEAANRRADAQDRRKLSDPECPPDLYPCVEEEDEEEIVVTGSRIQSPARAAATPVTTISATSVTNVQNLGVDEGDIVKMYGRFLIVLQDGRLFSADTGRRNGELRLVDRIDVYRSEDADVWYDEILVAANRIVATGYNYGQDATEFSVFSISRDGRFTREVTYFLTSEDYYDTENYATRLVNGNLVIYTPLPLSEADRHQRIRWPIVRRWLREGERAAAVSRGRNLFDARDIYRPIQTAYEPFVHTISVCPLGEARAGDELECTSTAVVAPPGREFYVSNDHIYLWTWPVDSYRERSDGACGVENAAHTDAAPSAIFQIPLAGGRPRAMFTRGMPRDQLAMDANGGNFRALAVWADLRCDYTERVENTPLRFFSAPLDEFSATPRTAAEARFTPLPSVGRGVENRFTDTHLIYAGRDSWSSYAPHPGDDDVLSTRLVALRTDRPQTPTVLGVEHSALRVERVGDNAVVTGYRDWRGLNVTLIDLSGTPRIGSTAFLAERYETEGRSHAFNAAVDPDGRGLMGLPTQTRRAESGRWWWRSASSDVSFLALENGQLSSIGAVRGLSPQHPDYDCEVSCIDWYGNTRALFIAGRIFALSGTELIEAEIRDGAIHDTARLNLTEPVRRRRSAGS